MVVVVVMFTVVVVAMVTGRSMVGGNGDGNGCGNVYSGSCGNGNW